MQIVIVGNAPLSRDHGSMVDAADLVVRFNRPFSWGGFGGRKFDIWVIANGRGGRQFAVRKAFADAPYRDLPGEIWFPRAIDLHRELRAAHPGFHPGHPAEKDFSRRILGANGLRQPVLRFDAEFYRHCLGLLADVAGQPGPVLIPSAGFMALNHVRRRFPEAEITLLGFTFQGWPGHPWTLEEEFVRRRVAEGALALIPT